VAASTAATLEPLMDLLPRRTDPPWPGN
jgi:hypothetical protein